jgi:hypothetical protein
MFGYLDLKADTQWVRVMPVRQNLFLAPEPIDAVVTLEHLGSGRIVTLNDSLFGFVDPRLGSVAYAYNFWTTERLEPEESYRLRAVRSDGASTTATVVMPPALEFSFLNDVRAGRESALLQMSAERLLFVEVLFAMQDAIAGDAAGSFPVRDHACAISYNGQTASVAGRVIRESCGDPHVLADIRLTERFAGGGAIIRTWKTGWDGRYRFEGIEPGADLVLDLGPGTSEVHLPRLAPGERHVGNKISVPVSC